MHEAVAVEPSASVPEQATTVDKSELQTSPILVMGPSGPKSSWQKLPSKTFDLPSEISVPSAQSALENISILPPHEVNGDTDTGGGVGGGGVGEGAETGHRFRSKNRTTSWPQLYAALPIQGPEDVNRL